MHEPEYEEYEVQQIKKIKAVADDGFEIVEAVPPLRYSKKFIDWRTRLYIVKQLPNDRWYVVGELGTESSCYTTKMRLASEYPDIEFRPAGKKLFARLKVKE